MEAVRGASALSTPFLHMVDATLSMLEGCKSGIMRDLCSAGSANGVVDGAAAPDSAQVASACEKAGILGHQLLALAQEVRQRQATYAASSHEACAIHTGLESACGEHRNRKRRRDHHAVDVERHHVGAGVVSDGKGTNILGAASVRVLHEHDLLQHVCAFAAGNNIRYMTRVACVSRAWRDVVYSAYSQWEDIAHRSLPFTRTTHRGEECPVLQGLLRSAGGYRGLLMRHREAVWLHRHGGGGGDGCNTSFAGMDTKACNVPEPRWYEQLGIIMEVHDHRRGECLLSSVGPLEWARGAEIDGEEGGPSIARVGRAAQSFAKEFSKNDMLLPWEDHNSTIHDYIDQDRRFVAHVIVVSQRGTMRVLCAWESTSTCIEDVWDEDDEDVIRWELLAKGAAYEPGTCGPVRAKLVLHVLTNRWGEYALRHGIDLRHGVLRPRVEFSARMDISPHNVFAEHLQTLLTGP